MDELERILQEAKGDEQRLEALLNVLASYKNKGFVEGWKVGVEALELAVKTENRKGTARAHEGLATVLWKLAEYSSSIEHFEQALDQYLGLGDLYAVARCYCGMGIISGTLEEYRTAIDYFEEGLSAARRSERHHFAATITGNIGHVNFLYGKYDDALACFQYSLEFYEEENEVEGIANMYGGMAGVYVYQGQYDQGLELVKKALALHQKTGHSHGIGTCMMNIGNALHKMGRLEEARTQLQSALKYARSMSLRTCEFDAVKNLSSVCAELGLEEESAEYLRHYMEGQKEEEKLSVKRKNEQFKQRQVIRHMQAGD